MALHSNKLHFVLMPFMCQGHLLPLIDIGRLLAARDVLVSIITTPKNAARFRASVESEQAISVLEVQFPSMEAGLPDGCETLDGIPSTQRHLMKNFIFETRLLQEPVEKLLRELNPPPNCIVQDKHFTWIPEMASKLRIPRIIYEPRSCFNLMLCHNIRISKVHECVPKGEPFVVPGFPDRFEFTTRHLSPIFDPKSDYRVHGERMAASEEGAYALIVNSFEELEAEYANSYRKITQQNVLCVGPVSLCNKDNTDKARRGNELALSTDENNCLKWLDSWPASAVIYVCFGTLNRITPPQLIELGLALEASNKPFIWVLRSGGYKAEEIEKWLAEERFEERVKGRGLLIRGWAPQLLILSHPSMGGYLTHCGWNSTLEGICAGVPMITWPLAADQFFNEKHIVQVLKIGVRVGVEYILQSGEVDKNGVQVKSEDIKKAIESLMEGGEEGEERRQRARKLGEMAKKAVDEGGSSYLNIAQLIEGIKQHATVARPDEA